jgi:uncharacterized protein (TIGR02145 family)
MKKIISTLFSLVFAIGLFAQQAPPQGINYQAMVYVPYSNQQVGVNSGGQIPANTKEVVVKFTLEEGNNGPVIYEETLTDTTDQYGLLNAVIGTGTPTSNSPGLFNQIDWSLGDPYLHVSITLTQYNSTVSSYQKLWRVPYALYADQANSSNYSSNSGHADSSDYANLAGNGITGVTDNGDGTLTFTYYDGSSYTTGVLSGLVGAIGPQGPAGANGQSAYDLWLAQGNTGTVSDFLNSLQGTSGIQGPAGANGLSAYQIWLSLGNTGTEQDFLNSLTGPQGPAGNSLSNGTVNNQLLYWNGTSWTTLTPGTNGQVLAICNNNLTWVTLNGVCPGAITGISCGTATNTGTLTSGIAASGVNSSVPYTGGNGGAHNGQSVASTGVTGLTATLAPGNFATGAGSLVYTISGTPNSSGTASFALNIGGQTCTLTRTVNLPVGTITSLSCGTATNSGTLISGTAASGVSSSVPYAGGNGGTHNGQTVTSTGVTGLTATLAAGTFANGSGNLTYIITGTPASGGTASFALNIGGKTCALTRTVGLPVGTITALSCGTATNAGTLTSGTAASGVSSSVPYTGGNGGTHNGQTVASTGVTGLTATLAAGTFAVGAGSLTYSITGTPSAGGTASFTLNIGGQTCTLTRIVNYAYPTGTVNCTSSPTAVVLVTNPTTGKQWMDRNLGATQVATSMTDANSYGDLYQWGRRADGHQCRTSPTTTTLSTTDQPTNGNFILVSTAPSDWRSPQNNNLWQGVNGTNNPCPIGLRLPTISEWQAELNTWSGTSANSAFASVLKLPSSGFRDAANTFWTSTTRYWSSTISGTISLNYGFNTSFGNLNTAGARAAGHGVRCIKN